jgi:AraC family transcriptional regulator of adaptative response / DNA-3-methyladenine glycosylase II
VRAILGQQVSVTGARTVAGRIARAYGRPLPQADGTLERSFPRAEDLAGARPADLPMPAARAAALIGLCETVAAGKIVLDRGAARDEVDAELAALPGIGPWTIAYIRMRALGDPDAFLASDLGVRRALSALGLPATPAAARAAAEAWRPFRAYALAHLWGFDPIQPTATPTKRSST